MNRIFKCAIAALALGGLAATAVNAAEVVGVRVGDAGVGFTVTHGSYYDGRHHRHYYNYPSDWRTYHHPRSWYRSHRQWNDQNGNDWYRR
jgi:hypothetical protein